MEVIHQVTATNNLGCTVASGVAVLAVYPNTPVIVSASGDTLMAYSANSYQWFLNGIPITGATSSIYVAQSSGTYTLQITGTNGCIATSSPILITGISENSITISPNPSTGNWQLKVSAALIGSAVQVYNATGQIVFKSEIRSPQSEITIPNIARGVYELRIISGSYNVVRKLVKM